MPTTKKRRAAAATEVSRIGTKRRKAVNNALQRFSGDSGSGNILGVNNSSKRKHLSVDKETEQGSHRNKHDNNVGGKSVNGITSRSGRKLRVTTTKRGYKNKANLVASIYKANGSGQKKVSRRHTRTSNKAKGNGQKKSSRRDTQTLKTNNAERSEDSDSDNLSDSESENMSDKDGSIDFEDTSMVEPNIDNRKSRPLLRIPTYETESEEDDGSESPEIQESDSELNNAAKAHINVLTGGQPHSKSVHSTIFAKPISVPISSQLSSKVKRKIWTKKYVDFALLLPTYGIQPKQQKFTLQLSNDSTFNLIPQSQSRKITHIAQWTSAFLRFVAVYTEKFPKEAPQLMKYG